MNESRKAFLARLEKPLRAIAPAASFRYGKGRFIEGPELFVSVKGRTGSIGVIAVSIHDNVKMFVGEFPGKGVPHFQLSVYDEQDDLRDIVTTCQVPKAVETFRAWLEGETSAPALATAPLSLQFLNERATAAGPAIPKAVRIDTSQLDPDARAVIDDDLRHLALRRMAHLFPLNDAGVAERGTRVLLGAYGPAMRERRNWLHVTAVRKNTLELGLEALIEDNHAHRWNDQRWMWDARVPVPSPAQRWGIAGDEKRIGQYLALVDAGRYGDALALYRIGHSPALARILAGRPASLHHTELASRWAEALGRALWGLAPWLFCPAINRQGDASVRLFALPGQTSQKKMSLFITKSGGSFSLVLESTGSNDRFPETEFMRPIEHDLARLNLAPPEIPAEGDVPIALAPAQAADFAKATGKLREKLRAPGYDAYTAAVKEARKLPAGVAAPLLVEAMLDAEPGLRQRGCEVAAATLNTGCLDAAIWLLGDENAVSYAPVCAYLSKIRHPPALPIIAAQLIANPKNAGIGASILRYWGEREGAEAFRAHLSSPNETIRAAACLAIHQYGPKAMIRPLLRVLAEDTPLVASAALHALRSMGEEADASLAARSDAGVVLKSLKRWQNHQKR